MSDKWQSPRWAGLDWDAEAMRLGKGGDVPQVGMFNVRVGTKFPFAPNGADISFHCAADDGFEYYCKGDEGARPVRATEWLATELARQVGLPVMPCAIIEDHDGATYFGSRSPKRYLADRFRLEAYINQNARDELGKPWLAIHLSRIFAFDHAINNPDRGYQNFILNQDTGNQLCAIDYASAFLLSSQADNSLVESDPTVRVGRHIREQHGSDKAAAKEVLARLNRLDLDFLQGLVDQMPDDWLADEAKRGFVKAWSNGRKKAHLHRLETVIENEW